MIVSNVEYLETGEIVGWAFDRQFGDDQLLIEAFVGDRLIGMAAADLPGTDPRPETHGHGFRIKLRQPLIEEAITDLAVYATALSGERARLSPSPESSDASTAARQLWNPQPSAFDGGQHRAPATDASDRRRTARSDIDIFVHIPKSGGSTIRTIISREYGIDHILYVEPGVSNDGSPSGVTSYVEHALSDKDIHLMTGHHPYGLHAILKQYCRYFSMLRDPIDRALSDYYYAYEFEKHRNREKILSGELTVTEYLTSGQYGIVGGQMRMLAAPGPGQNSVAKAAIENARISFCLVGITERFDESILLLAKILKWQPPLYVPTNLTRLDPAVKAARDLARADAHRWCYNLFKGDYEVYTAVNQLLSERISQEGEPFARALDAFREIQADISNWAGDRVYQPYNFAQGDIDPGLVARYDGSDAYQRILDYIASGDRVVRERSYIGTVDRYEHNMVVGWAADLSHDEPIEVTIQRAGEVVQRTSCTLRRDDLARKGYPRANLGFTMELKHLVGDPSDYAICFEETSIRLPGSS